MLKNAIFYVVRLSKLQLFPVVIPWYKNFCVLVTINLQKFCTNLMSNNFKVPVLNEF